jgi:hypothetical protein
MTKPTVKSLDERLAVLEADKERRDIAKKQAECSHDAEHLELWFPGDKVTCRACGAKWEFLSRRYAEQYIAKAWQAKLPAFEVQFTKSSNEEAKQSVDWVIVMMKSAVVLQLLLLFGGLSFALFQCFN